MGFKGTISKPTASELHSSASELSSLTAYDFHQENLPKPLQRLRGKRGLDSTGEDSEDVTPTKRAASCGIEDLSCMEATVFDRAFESECTSDVEAESQLLMSASAWRHVPFACSADITYLIRTHISLKYVQNLRDSMMRMSVLDSSPWHAAQSRTEMENEQVSAASPEYMKRHGPKAQAQHYLETSMRAVTVSWLVEVGCEFLLQQGTLFLAVDLLDRFLSKCKALPRTHLQLTAVACKMIASKLEQEAHPSAYDFTNIADHCFQVAELIKMESLILQTLQFQLLKPNAYSMLCLYRQALDLGKRDTALAMYLVELSILEYKMLRYKPSVIAAAAVLIVQAKSGDLESLVRLSLLTGMHLSGLQRCAEDITSLHEQAWQAVDMYNPFTAVKEKYRERTWHCASHEPPLDRAAVIFAVLAASKNVALTGIA